MIGVIYYDARDQKVMDFMFTWKSMTLELAKI